MARAPMKLYMRIFFLGIALAAVLYFQFFFDVKSWIGGSELLIPSEETTETTEPAATDAMGTDGEAGATDAPGTTDGAGTTSRP